MILFRRDETDWNASDKLQGWQDVPLNFKGASQAKELAERLESYGLEAILTSDLSRATKTAEIISEKLRICVFSAPEIKEISFGENEGRNGSEVWNELGPDFRTQWRYCLSEAQWALRMPGGESKEEVRDRAKFGIMSFVLKHPFRKLGISTHGGVLRYLVHSSLGAPRDPIAIANGAAYRLVLQLNPVQWTYLGPV